MPTWRKVLCILILVTLLVLTIVFWGSMGGVCCVIILIQSIMTFLFNRYACSDLAKTFQEDGEHVKGWRS